MIIPAQGWFARFKSDDGDYYQSRLIAWQEDEGGYVHGVVLGRRGTCLANEYTNFDGYTDCGGREDRFIQVEQAHGLTYEVTGPHGTYRSPVAYGLAESGEIRLLTIEEGQYLEPSGGDGTELRLDGVPVWRDADEKDATGEPEGDVDDD